MDFLIAKSSALNNSTTNKIKPGFGGGKGIFGKMSDDFDEALDDMKEYM